MGTVNLKLKCAVGSQCTTTLECLAEDDELRIVNQDGSKSDPVILDPNEKVALINWLRAQLLDRTR